MLFGKPFTKCLSCGLHTSSSLLALKGKTANLVLLQAAEKRRKKKQLVLDKLYDNLQKRIVPDKETNYDLMETNRQRQSGEPKSFAEINERAILDIKWSRFRDKQNHNDKIAIGKFVKRQWDALYALRNLDPKLYKQATSLTSEGVVESVSYLSKYPSKLNHEYQDGASTDVSAEKAGMRTKLEERINAARDKVASKRLKQKKMLQQQRLQLAAKK